MTSLTPRIDLLDSYPNLAINGDFELWQRGTSIAVTNAVASYLADRNQFYSGAAAATATITQSTDVPTFAQSNYRSKFSMLLTTTNQVASPGANATVGLSYKVEGYDYAILHGKPFRVQRWFKSSVIGTYAVCFTNSAQDRSYVTTFTINQANTWERKVFDLTGDTAGTWLFDNGIGLQMIVILQNNSAPKQTSALNTWQTGFFVSGLTQANLWAGTAGATFQMSQAMIIPGSFDSTTELTFRRTGRTFQQELAMCQRYYEKSYFLDETPGIAGAGTIDCGGVFISAAGITIGNSVSYKVTKRINAPTVRTFDTAGTVGQVTTQASGGATTNRVATLADNTSFAFAVSIVGGSDLRVQLSFDSNAEL